MDTVIEFQGQKVSIHSLELPAMSSNSGGSPSSAPLLFLPGYGTGAAIWLGLWKYWRSQGLVQRPLIAVDLLGMFLSSRLPWNPGVDVTKAEAWFAESLAAWCRARNLLHFDLLGHSLGATVAVALLERLSDPSAGGAGGAGGAVGRLVLLSPAGVCAEPTDYREKLRRAPWRLRLVFSLWERGWSPFTLIRSLSRRRAQRLCLQIARRWCGPKEAIDPEALGEYLYHGWTTGRDSAGHMLGALLKPGAWGKRPLEERLLKLEVPRIELIYGERDWMDCRHGNRVATASVEEVALPCVAVQLVEEAGHYAHLEAIPGLSCALLLALDDELTRRGSVPELPPGYAERFRGTPEKRVPRWRSWEGYDFGR